MFSFNQYMNKNSITTLNYLKKILGISLILIGIAGIFLPIIPGILIIILGSILIGDEKIKQWFKRKKQRLKTK